VLWREDHTVLKVDIADPASLHVPLFASTPRAHAVYRLVKNQVVRK
jgi:hypothetical protein